MKSIPMRSLMGVVALAALGACATQESDGRRPWRIEPVLHVQHSSTASEAHYRTGRYFDGMQRWADAADEYRKALAADPRHVDASNALGVALARQGDLGRAESLLRRAAALDPARADVLSNLGYVLLLAGRPAEAVGELQVAVAMDRGNTVAQENLHDARQRAGQTAVTLAPTVSAAPEPATAPSPTATAPAMQVIVEPTASWASEAVAEAPRPEPLLEISNGNGVAGAADRLRRWLAGHGVATQRLSNQKPYLQPATVVQFRGDHEDDARRLAQLLPSGAAVERSASLRTDLRVLIGRDWQRMAACLDDGACAPSLPLQLADAAPAR